MHEISRITERLTASDQPIFYLNRPATHLLGIERWVPRFYSIRLRELWASDDERVFTPSKRPAAPLSHEDSVLWLLRNEEVQRFIAEHTPQGMRPKVLGYFMHDAETEAVCAELGYDLCSITSSERHRLDSKMLTTRLSEEAGLNNVPHTITEVTGWSDLLVAAVEADLGTELVVQTDYGEAGTGTYFLRTEAEFEAVREHIVGVPLKVMRRITHRSLAMDAVVTDSGVIVGPLLQDIIGHPEVAIHKGASSGLEYYPDVLPEAQRQRATAMVIRYGEVLQAEGYVGLYEVDILHDTETGELWFGEANPRFSGCAMVTNATTAELWGLPLYAIHLAAFLGLTEGIDVDSINASWNDVPEGIAWSNLLLRQVTLEPQEIVSAPRSGRYRYAQGEGLAFTREEPDWFDLRDEGDVFFLAYRIDGDTMIYGSEYGSLYRRGRFQDYDGALTDESKALIAQISSMYVLKPLGFVTRVKNSLGRRANNAVASLRTKRR